MFTAIGVGVTKNGTKYDVKVDYFDDRVSPMKKVTTLTHTVGTKAELATSVQAQLQALKAADIVASLNADVQGKTLGSI